MDKNSPKNKSKTDKKRSSAAISLLLVVVTLAVLMMTSSSLGVTTHFADASIANNLPNLAISPSSTSMYKDSIGNIHIVGELQNNFTYPINFVQVIATLYDASKQVAGTGNTYTDVDFLRPGERSGFDIILSNSANNAVNYVLQATYEKALTTKSSFLNLSVGKGYQDSIGNYHLVGEVSNIGNNVTRFVKVSSIFFDAYNKVIDAVTTYTNPSDLRPGQKAPFDLLSMSPNSKEIKFAVVDVQSEDYSHNGAQQLLTLSRTSPASTMKSSSTTHGGGSLNPQHKLLVVIRIAKNPIVRGNTQTISVTVSDSKTSSVKIPGAKVNGEVLYVSGFVHKFTGITNTLGQMVPSYTWPISGDATPGQFKVKAFATKSGYRDGFATTSFTVIPKTNTTNPTNATTTCPDGSTPATDGSCPLPPQQPVDPCVQDPSAPGCSTTPPSPYSWYGSSNEREKST